MLIPDQIEFHNAAALETLDGLPGLCPVRVPRPVRDAMLPGARPIGLESVGVELRFVTPAAQLRLTVVAHHSEVTLHVYCGDFGHSDHRIPAGETRVLTLSPSAQLPHLPREHFTACAFAPEVWRVQINNGTLGFLGLDTFGEPLRPPTPAEKPRLRWLAYGSSITHSFGKGYPHQAARRLRVDVLNKGHSGTCQCEPALAEHFATAETWDFATLELGINMRGNVEPADFAGRVRHLVERLRTARPTAPLFLLTHFLNVDHVATAPARQTAAARQSAFDQILRDLATEKASQNVHLIEGRDVLTDFSGLSADLIHPSDYGHVQMGENLARLLAPHLPA